MLCTFHIICDFKRDGDVNMNLLCIKAVCINQSEWLIFGKFTCRPAARAVHLIEHGGASKPIIGTYEVAEKNGEK